jgi:hypothetical protein
MTAVTYYKTICHSAETTGNLTGTVTADTKLQGYGVTKHTAAISQAR